MKNADFGHVEVMFIGEIIMDLNTDYNLTSGASLETPTHPVIAAANRLIASRTVRWV